MDPWNFVYSVCFNQEQAVIVLFPQLGGGPLRVVLFPWMWPR